MLEFHFGIGQNVGNGMNGILSIALIAGNIVPITPFVKPTRPIL